MNDYEYEELISKLKKLWKKRKPFLMQMTAYAPYDGCFYEPNIFLITPPGSKLQKELQSNKESLDLRKTTLEKQEGRSREKLNEMQSKVENALNLASKEA